MMITTALSLTCQLKSGTGNRVCKCHITRISFRERSMEKHGALSFIGMLLIKQGIEQNPGPVLLNFWIFQFGYVTDYAFFVLVLTTVVGFTLLAMIRSLFVTAFEKRQNSQRNIPQDIPDDRQTQPDVIPDITITEDTTDGQNQPDVVPDVQNNNPDTTEDSDHTSDDKRNVFKDLKEATDQTGVSNVVVNVSHLETLQVGPGRIYRYSTSDTGSDTDQDVRNDPIDNTIKTNLLEYTRSRLQNRRVPYIKRSGLEAAIKKLEDNHIALITGVSGEGKTSMALEIMAKVSNGEVQKIQRKTPIIIHNPMEWQSVVGMEEHLLVLIDDIFGISNCSHDVLNNWKQMLKEISIYLKMGNIYLLVTSRLHILEEALVELSPLHTFDQYGQIEDCLINEHDLINLSKEYSLTESERISLFRSFTDESSEISIDDAVVQNILNRASDSIGFAQACCLFFSCDKLFAQGASFFSDPRAKLSEEICNMRENDKQGYHALTYCLLSKRQVVDLDNMDKMKTQMKYKRQLLMAADQCEFNQQDYTTQSLIEALKTHTGRLIVFDGAKYHFHHSSVIESALNVIGLYDPELVLKTCDERLIIENAVVGILEGEENKLLVPEQCYNLLTKRLLKAIQKDYSVIPSIRCLRNERFLKHFCSQLKTTEKLKKLFEVKMGTNTILEYCANNFILLAFFIKNGIKENIISQTTESTYKEHIQMTLEKALRHGNVLSTKLLLGNGGCFTRTTLFDASLSGNPEILKYLLQCNMWKKDQLELGMRGAVMSKNSECVTYLHQKGCSFNSACLLDAVNYAELDCIIYILSNFHSASSNLEEVMETACRRGDKDIITCFLEVGVKLTEQCLSDLVEHLSTAQLDKADLLEMILQTKSWTQTQLTRTINEACYSQRLYIIKLLHRHGGVIDEQGLISAVTTGPFEVVEYVLSVEKWTQDQLNAALEEAILNGHLATVQLVHDKGGQLSDKSLTNAVKSYSASKELLEYITDSRKWSRDQFSSALRKAVKNWKTSSNRPACDELYQDTVLYLIQRGALLSERCIDDISDIDEDFAVQALQSTFGYIF